MKQLIGKFILFIIKFLWIGPIGISRIPARKKPILYVLNHPGWADGFILRLVFPNVRIMAIKGIQQIFGPFLGYIPATIKDAVQILKGGEDVAICSEGWVYADGKQRPFKTGAAVISFQVPEAQVIPINIQYGEYYSTKFTELPLWFQIIIDMCNLTKRRYAYIIIGDPVKLSGNIQEDTKLLEKAVFDLTPYKDIPKRKRK